MARRNQINGVFDVVIFFFDVEGGPNATSFNLNHSKDNGKYTIKIHYHAFFSINYKFEKRFFKLSPQFVAQHDIFPATNKIDTLKKILRSQGVCEWY